MNMDYYNMGYHNGFRDATEKAKAEIERLSSDRYLLKEDGTMTLLPRTDVSEIKAEAIKEFAERLEQKAYTLVKEMVGERE